MKAGMKQTEIGWIPDDWRVSTLSSIVDEKRVIRYGIVQPGKFHIDGVLLVRGQDYSRKWASLDEMYRVSPTIDRAYQNARIGSGDILLTIVGNGTGNVAVVPSSIASGNITQTTARIAVSADNCSRFVYQLLVSNWGQNEVRNYIKGGAQPGLNIRDVEKFKLPLPEYTEQRTIGEALSDTDAWIESLEALLLKKRLIKQGAMQELLRPKEGWEVKSIFEIADSEKAKFNDGDWIEAEHIRTSGIRLLQTGNIGLGKLIDSATKKFIDDKSFKQVRCKELYIGDLLICRLADPAGRACILTDISADRIVTSVDVTIFRPDSKRFDRRYLMYVMCTAGWFSHINENVGGTTHKRISRGNLGKIKISVPELCEQKRIGDILSDIDSELDCLEQSVIKARQIKQGMMQQLLTGQIRLVPSLSPQSS